MSKKFKKLTMLVLSLCCSVGLAACGGLDNRSGGNSSTVKQSYTVTFDANGGSTVDAQTVEEGALATIPTVPTKVGYTFEGWFVDGVEFDFTTTTITENVTLTAQWTANDDTFYNVEVYWETVDGQFIKLTQQDVGANVPLVRVGTTDSAVNLTEEANQVVATMPGFELDQTQSVLTGTINGDGSSVFKAYLSRKTYTLSFSGVAAESIPVKYGATVDFESLPAIPTQTDKVSVWKLDGTTVSADFEWTYTENKELTAIYMGVPRTVTFLVDGATFATETVENNTTVTKPATDPEKTGYTFAGWYVGETQFDFTNAITGDTEIIANFTANTYTLLLDKKEGTGGDESVSVTYDAAISTLPTLTKTGYDFVNWTIDGEEITNETVWKYTQDKTAVANWKIQSYDVTFKVDGLTIPGTIVEFNKTATAPTVAGYDITWDFDFATPITKTTEISGTKEVKALKLKDTSKMRAGSESYDVQYENGKMGLLVDKACSHALAADWYFDLTVEDIEAFKTMGYTHLTYNLYINVSDQNGSNKYVMILHDERKVDITFNALTPIQITLDELQDYVQNNKKVFIRNGWCYYTGKLYVQDMKLAKMATVTFKDGDTTVYSGLVEKGTTVNPASVPGYDVIWMYEDTEFDFKTTIEEDVTLSVGQRTLKTIRLTDDSVISVKSGDTAVASYDDGAIGGIATPNSADSYSYVANWKFDLTEEDLTTFKSMGYTHFTFMLYVWSSATDITSFEILNFKTTVALKECVYTPVTITLDELATYVKSGNGIFHSSTWLMYYIGEIRIKDMRLAKMATVTYMDGETKISEALVELGECATAIDVPGYKVTWQKEGVDFDFASSISEDIVLLAADKTLKTISVTPESYVQTGKGNLDIETREEDGAMGLLTQSGTQEGSSSSYYAVLRFTFDLTTDDIDAFIKLGYTDFTFKLYGTCTYGNARSATLFKGTDVQRTVQTQDSSAEGKWNTITVSLDDLKAYIASGKNNFVEYAECTWAAKLMVKDMVLVKADA